MPGRESLTSTDTNMKIINPNQTIRTRIGSIENFLASSFGIDITNADRVQIREMHSMAIAGTTNVFVKVSCRYNIVHWANDTLSAIRSRMEADVQIKNRLTGVPPALWPNTEG